MQWFAEEVWFWLIAALAVYGLACIIMHVWPLLDDIDRQRSGGALTLVVLVRNQERQIEGFVRSASNLIHSGETMPADLLLIDVGSTDDTLPILERLAQRDPKIRLVRLPEGPAVAPYETALFLSRGQVAVLVDLRGKASATAILRTLEEIW